MGNKVQFGLKSVHVAFRDPDTGAWETPTPIPGAVNLSLTGEGDRSNFRADDSSYWAWEANNGYTGELEMALLPDAILSRMLGWTIDSNGMLVEVADGTPEEFALLFEVAGNEADKRYIFYSCTAGRPGVTHQTTGETVEPQTQALPLVIEPVEYGDDRIVKGVLELSDTNATVYNAFFTTVQEPDEASA